MYTHVTGICINTDVASLHERKNSDDHMWPAITPPACESCHTQLLEHSHRYTGCHAHNTHTCMPDIKEPDEAA